MKNLISIKKIILLMALCVYFEPCWSHSEDSVDLRLSNGDEEPIEPDIVEERLKENFTKENRVIDSVFFCFKNGTGLAIAVFITYYLSCMKQNLYLLNSN